MVHKGSIPWNKGKTASEEIKLKLSNTHKKLWENLKYKKHMSEVHKGQQAGHKWKKGNLSWNKGLHLPEETRIKLSMAHKGKPAWNKGKPQSEEARMKNILSHKGQISWNKGLKGKHWSEESKKKMSIAHKGKIAWNKGIPQSKEAKRKNILAHLGKTTWNKGKHWSEESKKKMSIAHKGRNLSEEHKGKISKIAKEKGFGKWMTGRHLSEETMKKLRVSWDKPEYRQLRREIRAKLILPLKDSKPEIKIQNFLNQLGIAFLKHKHIKIEHAYQCDLLIPSINLILEVDGNYWHKFPVGRDIDRVRTKELQEKGYKVLRLWESDIKKMNIQDFAKCLEKV